MTARGLEISPMQIAVRDLVEGYVNDDEDGVFGYGGRLNIRPPYQREFIYGEKEAESRHSQHPQRSPHQCDLLDG